MGNQFSNLPAGFQPDVDTWYGVLCTRFHFIPDFRDPDVQDVSFTESNILKLQADQCLKYFLKNCAYTGCFMGLLLILTLWCGQSGVEKGVDPVESAGKERDAAIEERNDAQKAWGEVVLQHERAIQTNLELRAESNKAFKDLPWLEKKNFELAEENIVQYNEIEHLKIFQQKYDELLHQVCEFGLSAKRPEHYQQRTEQVQRQLVISNNLLERSEMCVKSLKEKLDTQHEKSSEETTWLRAKLKKNSRSTAYHAKHRLNGDAWGIRCACTEPEIAYALRDQSPRIVELEATVAARDRTITNLRESRSVKNVSKNGTASTSNAARISLSSTNSDFAGSETATTTLVHAQEQCRKLSKQVADDAETLEGLREECQKLRDAASDNTTVDVAEINAEAELKKELTTKETVIQDLQKQLTARNDTISNLEKENVTAKNELAKNRQTIKDLRDENANKGKELNAKKEEVGKLREEKRNARTEISKLDQQLSESRKELEDAREEIEQKDCEIEELENANQEIAGQPDPETARSLATANSNLEVLRREHAECKGHSDTQAVRIRDLEAAEREAGAQAVRISELEATARNAGAQAVKISELEAAGRDAGAAIQVRDDRIAALEEQINNANQSHDAAITQGNYQMLNTSYQHLLEQQRLAEAQVKQNDAANLSQYQRVCNDYQSFSRRHGDCDKQIDDLRNQLRQDGNLHTNLQTRYNTQATELEVANQNQNELQGEVVKLQQMISSLKQMNSSSESNFEKYRIEGENRARPVWQANLDRELSAQALKLEASEGQIFKLKNQLKQAKTQANPLQEVQLKEREDAVKLREDALKSSTDTMDHDQQGSSADPEFKDLEARLMAANKEANDAKLRNRGIQKQLNKEKQDRTDEQAKHEKALKKEQEDSKKSIAMLKVRLEKDNPLKGAVSKLQNEVMRLSKELEEQKARGNDA